MRMDARMVVAVVLGWVLAACAATPQSESELVTEPVSAEWVGDCLARVGSGRSPEACLEPDRAGESRLVLARGLAAWADSDEASAAALLESSLADEALEWTDAARALVAGLNSNARNAEAGRKVDGLAAAAAGSALMMAREQQRAWKAAEDRHAEEAAAWDQRLRDKQDAIEERDRRLEKKAEQIEALRGIEAEMDPPAGEEENNE